MNVGGMRTGSSARVVIVGASAAGVATANELRHLGHSGEIHLVGDEQHLPYDRPPLSKEVLAGAWDLDRIRLGGIADYEGNGIDLHLGSPAVGLDAGQRILHLGDGSRLPYDLVVAATGVSPRRLPCGEGLDGVHYLRTLDDSLALSARLIPGQRIGIVGAGFVGLEVASLAAKVGCVIDIVEPQATPLANRIGPALGLRIQELHERHGVRFHLNSAVDSLLADRGRVTGLVLGDGGSIAVDDVVVGIGTVPNDGWLSSLADSADPGGPTGVRCDEYGKAADRLYAAGDVAAIRDIRTGRHVRTEHRMNATEQARHVARSILGAREPFLNLPFFWTDQYDVKLQLFGTPTTDAEFTVEFESADPHRLVGTYRDEGVLVAAAGWQAAKQLMPYRKELASRLLAEAR